MKKERGGDTPFRTMGIQNYSWKVSVIQNIFENITDFSFLIFYAKLQKCVDKMFQFLYTICKTGIMTHFGTENYAFKAGIVQDLCKYCQFFLYDILGPNCPNTTNARTTRATFSYF